MTTEVEARDAIVAYLNPAWVTAYPSIKIFYENTTKVNLDSVGSMLLRVSIDFTDSIRQGLDPAPITGSYGEIGLQILAKDGTGSRDVLQKLNFLRETLKYQKLTGVELGCPRQGTKQSKSGWTSHTLVVPFQFWQ